MTLKGLFRVSLPDNQSISWLLGWGHLHISNYWSFRKDGSFSLKETPLVLLKETLRLAAGSLSKWSKGRSGQEPECLSLCHIHFHSAYCFHPDIPTINLLCIFQSQVSLDQPLQEQTLIPVLGAGDGHHLSAQAVRPSKWLT